MTVWKAFLATVVSALALLVAAPARAAVVLACEPVSDALFESDGATGPTSCEAPAAERPAGDLGDPSVAGLCDERGASVVAQERVLPIPDARIQAAPCPSSDGSAPHASRIPDGPSHVGPPLAPVDDAVLAALDALGAPPLAFTIAWSKLEGRARAGVRRAIEHPPRPRA